MELQKSSSLYALTILSKLIVVTLSKIELAQKAALQIFNKNTALKNTKTLIRIKPTPCNNLLSAYRRLLEKHSTHTNRLSVANHLNASRKSRQKYFGTIPSRKEIVAISFTASPFTVS